MTDENLIEALDGLRNAISNREIAKQAIVKFDGEVARLSGVVTGLLQGRPEATVVEEEGYPGSLVPANGAEPKRKRGRPPSANPIYKRVPKFSAKAIADDVMEKLAAAPKTGMSSRELLPSGTGFRTGTALGMLSLAGKIKRLPNGNWVAA